jgi:hypothetical protein
MTYKLHPFVHYSTALANIVSALNACERAGFMGAYKQLQAAAATMADESGWNALSAAKKKKSIPFWNPARLLLAKKKPTPLGEG